MRRFVRYQRDMQIGFGLLEAGSIQPLSGWIYQDWEAVGEALPLSEVVLLSPCTPTKIVGAGLNYRSVAEAKGKEIPKEPILFLKPPSAVIGPEAPIVHPSRVRQLGFELELAVVIGRRCHRIAPEVALQYVLGYTLANDVTAKDLMPASGPWLIGKGFDTFQPLGPSIVTDLNPGSIPLEMRLNGERVQQGSTEDLIFSVPELVSYASQILTLEPGDVLLTGTPPGGGLLEVGDCIEARSEPLGTLSNIVVAEEVLRSA